jgi:hypothetical protein
MDQFGLTASSWMIKNNVQGCQGEEKIAKSGLEDAGKHKSTGRIMDFPTCPASRVFSPPRPENRPERAWLPSSISITEGRGSSNSELSITTPEGDASLFASTSRKERLLKCSAGNRIIYSFESNIMTDKQEVRNGVAYQKRSCA